LIYNSNPVNPTNR